MDFNLEYVDVVGLEKIRKLLTKDEISNLMVIGNPGCGKKTIVRRVLGEIYGTEQVKTRIYTGEVKNNGNTYEFMWRISNVHYEIDASDFMSNDRTIIMSMLNELRESGAGIIKWKIVMIQHCNKLSLETWMALRKFIETYMDQIRFIFLGNSLSGIPEFIRSRLNVIRYGNIEGIDRSGEKYMEWGNNLYLWTCNHNKYNLPLWKYKIKNKILRFIREGKLLDWNELRKDLIKYISLDIDLIEIIRQVIIDFIGDREDGNMIMLKVGSKLDDMIGLDKDILFVELIILELKTL